MEVLQAIGLILTIASFVCVVLNIAYARIWQSANKSMIEEFKSKAENSKLTLFPKNHSKRMIIFLLIGVVGVLTLIVSSLYIAL